MEWRNAESTTVQFGGRIVDVMSQTKRDENEEQTQDTSLSVDDGWFSRPLMVSLRRTGIICHFEKFSSFEKRIMSPMPKTPYCGFFFKYFFVIMNRPACACVCKERKIDIVS